ncbi:uncharacterized protein LOC125178036 [Hyalella azteca]|uniref:Uncharacterized protein LOC125178036 n=1 Tax=Hyalella azteca TaxID=294128 RepID=A0A979FJG7_HYAAZ|nr:uncharacterized protein LOC125178036 [Hyalella azteca]
MNAFMICSTLILLYVDSLLFFLLQTLFSAYQQSSIQLAELNYSDSATALRDNLRGERQVREGLEELWATLKPQPPSSFAARLLGNVPFGNLIARKLNPLQGAAKRPRRLLHVPGPSVAPASTVGASDDVNVPGVAGADSAEAPSSSDVS